MISHFQYYNIHANERDYLVSNWEQAHISRLNYGNSQEFEVVKKQNDRRLKKKKNYSALIWSFGSFPLYCLFTYREFKGREKIMKRNDSGVL